MAVTDQYLRAIAQLDELEPDALAGFIDVASLPAVHQVQPVAAAPGSEEEEEEDAGEALIRHLLEYRQFKQAANSLKDRVEAGQRAFARVAPAPQSQAR